MKLYRCNVCGKIVAEVEMSGAMPVCCGETMTLLTSKMTDGAIEKHVPVYEKKGNVICVKVGEEEHPMTDMHHVEFIILETTMGFYLRYIFRKDCEKCFPGACFYLAPEEKAVAVYEYCNIHGLYESVV